MEFFGDPTLPEHLRQSTVFVETLTKHMLRHHARMREFAESYVATRERMGLPPANADNEIWARAVDVILDGSRRVDLLTSRDVAAAVRTARAAVRRAEQKWQHEQLVEATVAHVRRNRTRLAADAELENRARMAGGKQPIDADELVVMIAVQDVSSRPRAGPTAPEVVRRLIARVKLRLAAQPSHSRAPDHVVGIVR